ncbi:MAG: hypothetical protein ACI9OJ_002882 [Myxococcota bacterium]|jgi:hypothetical protein
MTRLVGLKYLLVVGLLCVGCSDDPVQPAPSSSGNADVQTGFDGSILADTPLLDEDGTSVSEDNGGTVDATTVDVPDGPCGTYGCSCSENSECDSSFCIEGPDGFICTEFCVEDCPSGAECKTITVGGGDPVVICVPSHVRLCRPCQTHSECAEDGGQALCLPSADPSAGSFCTSSCENGQPCPDSYACSPVTLPNGAQSNQCVPISGQCECRDSWADKGYETTCSLTNQFGECAGTRECGPAGLSSCTGALPTLEICNGTDDDCNGETDDVSEDVCINSNDFGTCPGVDGCSDGAAICAGPIPAPDICNGADDDCDGTTDEGSCDDSLVCTDDICSGDLACQNPLADGACLIDGACYFAGDANPSDPCEQCLPLVSQTAWSDAADLSCNDGDACTHSDVCSAGTCSGQPFSCNDGLTCTDNLCDGEGGCTEVLAASFCLIDGTCYADDAPKPGQPCMTCKANNSPKAWSAGSGNACNDGNVCTSNDICSAGSCGGTSYSCEDNNDCTIDVCSGDGTCAYTQVADSCLIAGQCIADGSAKPGEPCQACRPDVTKTAWSAVEPGAGCNDGESCTHTDKCLGGACLGTSYDCDDDLTCTDDSCGGTGDCVNAVQSGKCLINSECYANGDVNPANPCQVCNGTFSKQWSPIASGTVCSDGNTCTFNDSCQFGSCNGTPYQCNDGKPCTTDSCDGDGTCTYDIGDACVINSQCVSAGTAQPGNPCMACQPTISKEVWTASSGLSCNDGDLCTKSDVCQSGVCKGQAFSCDDSLSCTTDVCNGSGGCNYPLAAGQCLISGVCYANNQSNPSNSCQRCSSGTPTAWSNTIGGCNDSNSCTENDTCSGGVCIGDDIEDIYEPNDSAGAAKVFSGIEDNDDYPTATFTASLYGTGDVDWYRYAVEDVFGGSIFPRADLQNLPSKDYRVCMYFTCDGGDNETDVSCEDGTASTNGGRKGCCGNGAGSANETVRLNPNCNGTDDSGVAYVRVTNLTPSWTCNSYTLRYGDD